MKEYKNQKENLKNDLKQRNDLRSFLLPYVYLKWIYEMIFFFHTKMQRHIATITYSYNRNDTFILYTQI